MCHAPHEAATTRGILRDTGGASGELSLCYTCHDGSGASRNIQSGVDNSFALASGHMMEDVDPATDLTNTCSSCHSPHREYESNPSLPKGVINGTTVTVFGQYQGWYVVLYGESIGYANAAFIQL